MRLPKPLLLSAFSEIPRMKVSQQPSRERLPPRPSAVHFAAADNTVLPGLYPLATKMLKRYPEATLFAGDSLLTSIINSNYTGFFVL